MPLDLNSSRQRALSRRSLLTLVIAMLLAGACLLSPARKWRGPIDPPETRVNGAPPEAALRPNPPTEPIRGPSESMNGV